MATKIQPEIDSRHTAEIDASIARYLSALDAGCAIPVDDFLQAFPTLMPVLAQRLEVAIRIRNARLAALNPILGESSSDDWSESESGEPANFPVTFGEYVLHKPIGSGTFGLVYLASGTDNRSLAIKILRSEYAQDQDLVRRFYDEAKIAATVQHEGLVPIIDSGHFQGRPFLAMNYIDGLDLKKLYHQERLSVTRTAAIIRDVALACHSAHVNRIYHRDIKPGNILVECNTGKAFLTDFGLAKRLDATSARTRPSQQPGTPQYMAPEQIDSKLGPIGAATDVYSLGATLYFLLTGKTPFESKLGAADEALHWKILWQTPIRPSKLAAGIPEPLDIICCKCLEKMPQDRYATAADLAHDLHCTIIGQPIKGRRAGVVNRTLRLTQRQPLIAALLVGLCLTVGALALTGNVANRFKRDFTTAQKTAGLATSQASEAAAQAAHTRYLADMNEIPVLWQRGEFNEISHMLAKYEEPATSALRGFEWYYWRRRTDARNPTWNVAEAVTSLAWSDDGKHLYATDSKGRLITIDVHSGEKRQILGLESNAYNVIGATANGELFIVARSRSDSWISMYNLTSGRELLRINEYGWTYQTAAVFPTSKQIAASDIAGRLFVFDTETGQFKFMLRPLTESRPLPGGSRGPPRHVFRGPVFDITYSADGAIVATSEPEGCIGLSNAGNGKLIRCIRRTEGEIGSVTFSPDGTKLLARGYPIRDKFGDERRPSELLVWDVQSGELLRSIPVESPLIPEVSDQAVSERLLPSSCRADFVADATMIAAPVGFTINIWDVKTGLIVRELKNHGTPITSLRVSPDGNRIASGDAGGEIRIWTVVQPSGEELLAEIESPIHGLAITADQRWLASLSDAGVRFTSNSNELHPSANEISSESVLPFENNAGKFCGLVRSPSAKFIAAFDPNSRQISIWDLSSKKPIGDLTGIPQLIANLHGESFQSATQRQRLKCIAFGNDDELYFVTDVLLGRLKLSTQSIGKVQAPVFSTALPSVSSSAIPYASIRSLAFSPNGTLAVVGLASGEIIVCDTETWKLQRRLSGHTRSVTQIEFATDGRRMISCSGRPAVAGNSAESNDRPGEIILWDCRAWKSCLTLQTDNPSEFAGVAITNDGRSLIAACNPVSGSYDQTTHGRAVRWSTTLEPTSRRPTQDPAVFGPLAVLSVSSFLGEGPIFDQAEIEGFSGLEVSPSGNYIAATTERDHVILWDFRNRQIVAEARIPLTREMFVRHRVRTHDTLTFSADGSRLLCYNASHMHAVLFSIPKLEVVAESFKGDQVTAAAIGEDGQTLTTLAYQWVSILPDLAQSKKGSRGQDQLQNEVRNFFSRGAARADVGSGRIIKIGRPNHAHNVMAIVEEDRGSKLRIQVVSCTDGTVVFTTPFSDFRVESLGFSRNDSQVYAVTVSSQAAENAERTLYRWDAQTGRELQTIQNLGTTLAIAPDLGHSLEQRGGDHIYLRNLTTGHLSARPVALAGARAYATWFPDNASFATFTATQNTICTWNITHPVSTSQNISITP